MTDIRTAILQAADHIERNPWALEFSDGRIPSSIIYARVCPLAWIGFFAGMGAFDVDHANAHDTVAAQFLKLSDWAHSGQQVFYQRMTDLCGYTDRWRYEGGVCAQALRAYADQYHPTATATGGLAFINKIKTMIESEQIQERIAEEV